MHQPERTAEWEKHREKKSLIMFKCVYVNTFERRKKKVVENAIQLDFCVVAIETPKMEIQLDGAAGIGQCERFGSIFLSFVFVYVTFDFQLFECQIKRNNTERFLLAGG